MDELRNLLNDIDKLRNQLNKLINNHNNLNDHEIISASQILDSAIAKYYEIIEKKTNI